MHILFLPSADMEWLNGRLEESMEVDIGYMPEMKLLSTRSSVPMNHGGIDIRNEFIEPVIIRQDQLKWDEMISEEKSETQLSKELFPFQKV